MYNFLKKQIHYLLGIKIAKLKCKIKIHVFYRFKTSTNIKLDKNWDQLIQPVVHGTPKVFKFN